ncbi:MAG: molecular chaperone DnaK (HSP70) [Myxococcota bacterium]
MSLPELPPPIPGAPPAQYVVGIDLGTTHCALAYAKLDDAKKKGTKAVQSLDIDQLIGPGELKSRALLASAVYLPGTHDLEDGALALPFGDARDDVVGELARAQGARVPGRLVTSAKSWLCHAAVDRRAAILPPGAPADAVRLSPVSAQARLLLHLRDVWDYHFPDAPLRDQRVVLAVPASFDAIARTLTIEAAEAAGITNDFSLIEEPQAAFYDYYALNQKGLTDAEDDRLVLVVDVGGGTTDLTLIQVTWKDGLPNIRRLAVGDHILLGGDNMDMTLARLAEEKMAVPGGRLDPARWTLLTQSCRLAKEAMLGGGDDPPDSWKVTVPGRGSRLLKKSLATELTREEITRVIVEGFLPIVQPDARPERAVRSGLAQLGLPFESDTAVSRHIAGFLARHGENGASAKPDAILLNGGVFQSPTLQQRVVDVVSTLVGNPVSAVGHGSLDRAVARGATVFGLVRDGVGTRISGGSALAYYVEVAGAEADGRHAICVIPRGHEVDDPVDLSRQSFSLVVGRPVEFTLFATSTNRREKPGDVVVIDSDDFLVMPPVQTMLEYGGRAEIPIVLQASLSEVGVLEMACQAVDRDARWRLEFNLRGTTPRPATEVVSSHVDAPKGLSGAAQQRVAEQIDAVFGKPAKGSKPNREVRQLPKALWTAVGARREDWSLPVLRDIWEGLAPGAKRRRRSADHEAVFYNLAGYCLRPGFGYPLDEWRMKELWSLFEQDVEFHQEDHVWHSWWVMWRRVVGGLDTPQQTALLESIRPWLRPRASDPKPKGKRRLKGQEEMLRLIAALERVDPATKADWGNWLIDELLGDNPSSTAAWCLARLGARVPFSGAVHNVVDPEVAEDWVHRLLQSSWKKVPNAAFATAHIARRTDDRMRDLDGTIRARAAAELERAGEHDLAEIVRHVTKLKDKAASQFVGESLPAGLLIN